MSPWQPYVESTAELLDLAIPPEILPSVVENFERLVAIAQPVLTFPLGDGEEPAPVFDPLPPNPILNSPPLGPKAFYPEESRS